MNDHDLSERLHSLADRIDPPAPRPADDLARGRRRVRRLRVGLGTVAVLVAAGVTVAALGPGSGTSADRDIATEAPTPSSPSTPTSSPTTAPTATPDPTPAVVRVPPSPQPRDHSMLERDPRVPPVLEGWEAVLASHLDPAHRHLVPWAQGTQSEQASGGKEIGYDSLGSKYSWHNAGESGEGEIQLGVSASWADAESFADWQCDVPGTTWQCRDVSVPGAHRARVASHDGITDVAVERADGEVVRLTVDVLFGNDSVVPVSGIDVSESDLLAAAADPRFTIPSDLAAAPDVPLAPGLLRRVGMQHLVAAGDDLRVTYATDDSANPGVQAVWSHGSTSGSLSWDAGTVSDPVTEPSCYDDIDRYCESRQVEGRQVFVGYYLANEGGGYDVTVEGPVHYVTLRWEGADEAFPLQRAIALVTDQRLQ